MKSHKRQLSDKGKVHPALNIDVDVRLIGKDLIITGTGVAKFIAVVGSLVGLAWTLMS